MKRMIESTEGVLTYELVYKQVKNLNLRVKPDGAIMVSAPRRVSGQYVDNFVQKRAAWIRAAQERQRNTARSKPDPRRINEAAFDHKMLYLEGVRYQLEIVESKEERICLDASTRTVRLETRYPQNAEKMQRIVDKWIEERALALLRSLVSQYAPMLPEGSRAPGRIRLRKMKARYGSCFVRSGDITFARMLYACPRAFIEYVVVHELAHLAVAGHDARFYAVVHSILPDYKERQQQMKDMLRTAMS